jgi:putative hemolysin
MNSNLWVQLLLIIVLILINSFFAASEISIITLNHNKLKKLTEDGNPKAKILAELVAQPSKFLASIQVGVTISGLLASAVASESFADPIAGMFAHTSISPSLIKVLAVAIITVILSYFTLVFGELVPKRIAMQNSEKVALGVAGILSFLSVAFRPFVVFLASSTNVVVRMFGVDPNGGRKNVTEEEIRMMVDVGEESGVIEESEKDIINNVFDFNDRTAGEIMTHRTDIFAVETTATLDEIVKLGIDEGYSRIPVFEDDLDNIVGIIYVKDLLKFISLKTNNEFDIMTIMRKPLFIPETKNCRELFSLLTGKKLHMAVVVDEYGGTAGIVTLEDLIESILGNIQDEYDDEEEDYSIINDTTFNIDGSTTLEEVSRLLDVDLPEGDYDTVAGLVIDLLGRIPSEGEHPCVTVSSITFTVDEVEERRIERIIAVKNIVAAEGSDK